MNLDRLFKSLSILSIVSISFGCATIEPPPPSVEDSIVYPDSDLEGPTAGSLYNPGRSGGLFEDMRASRVGDVITIYLEESINASKSSSTSAAKGSQVTITPPTVAGSGITYKGNPVFDANIASDSEFSGEGDSAQSNSLEGSITVVVTKVLSNGNMVVKGDKWITLNSGDEFVRFSGLVRSSDISPDNTVSSTKVANARIHYGGRGIVSDSSKAGWLTRFFMHPAYPF